MLSKLTVIHIQWLKITLSVRRGVLFCFYQWESHLLPWLTFPSISHPIKCLHFVFNYCIIKRELLCAFKHDHEVKSVISVAAGIGERAHCAWTLRKYSLKEASAICCLHLIHPNTTQGHTKFKGGEKGCRSIQSVECLSSI